MGNSEVKVPRLLTLKQVEELTGIKRWRVYELIKQGRGLKHIRIGKTIRISETALAEFITKEEQSNRSSTEEEL